MKEMEVNKKSELVGGVGDKPIKLRRLTRMNNPMDGKSRELVTSSDGSDMFFGGIPTEERDSTNKVEYDDIKDQIEAGLKGDAQAAKL
jgi:hypothetical protein